MPKQRIKYHAALEQGSPEWLSARCGLLTASEMKLIITPKLAIADNDKSRSHMYELLAQRITKYVEPAYISDAMLRGQVDEIEARDIYSRKYAPVQEMGFITNTRYGFKFGGSPDGLVGDDGLIEIKSRSQKFQAETIINQQMPDDYLIQVQTLLLITERKWCDFISFCAGMPMTTIRVLPDRRVQEAIVEAALAFETKLAEKLEAYRLTLKAPGVRMVRTKRKTDAVEMYV